MFFLLRLICQGFGFCLLLLSLCLSLTRRAEPQSPWITFAHDSDLYRIRPDGSDLAPLTNNYQQEGSHSWSPDGRWIVFTNFQGGNPEIYRMRATGRDLQRLTYTPQGMSSSPAWSPDGAWIAFASNQSGEWTIYKMRPDGSNLQLITPGDAPVWSPNGQQIAFAHSQEMSYQIFMFDADQVERLTRTLENTYHSPSWWGDSLTFIGSTKGEFTHLYRLNLDVGSEEVFLQEPNTAYYFPVWSPDGEWIAYIAQHIDPGASFYETTLHKIRADGTGDQRLSTLRRNVWSPQWSPVIDLPWQAFRPGTGGLILLILGIIGLRKRRVA